MIASPAVALDASTVEPVTPNIVVCAKWEEAAPVTFGTVANV